MNKHVCSAVPPSADVHTRVSDTVIDAQISSTIFSVCKTDQARYCARTQDPI